ncbi:hypothetical protein INT44_005511 [Umbelopsis vinacea]|uniref:Uncharacterized protein n=1 Tax=Umbelopsis vinacea TaxID=44442 RepID=A0A8H7UJ42_9FUNG|nr:hypothetical protein INT44_005511 [Umbelopsis vinacea]
MTQPTHSSVASKRHGDIALDGDHAALETVTTSSYSEENYRKLKRRLKDIVMVRILCRIDYLYLFRTKSTLFSKMNR